MKAVFCVTICALFFATGTKAQSRPHFSSTVSTGLAAGERTNALILETVNGLKFKDWFAGAGAGIDFYRYKTLPLFANGKKYFGAQKRGFGYGSIGYNFPLKNRPGPEMGYYDKYHFSGGMYVDAGVGYAFPLAKRSSLLFSAGYSYKELQADKTFSICPLIPPCYEDHYEYKLNYGRIVLKAGMAL